MSSLQDRLLVLLENKRMSQEELANAIGASQAAISKIVLGETKRSRFLPKIADVLGVSEQWLIYGDLGESNAQKIDKPIGEWDSRTQIPDDTVAVPFFIDMSLSAGKGSMNSDLPYTGAVLWYSKSFIKRRGACVEKVFCITVSGDSMTPRYDEGGVVLIDSTEPINIIDGKAYAITYQDQDYIKYLRRMPNDRVLISSENPIYKPFEVDIEEIQVVGRVISYHRED